MEWSPIETAPALNGGSQKAVLVWCPENECIFCAWWDQDEGWWTYFGGGIKNMQETPTHWMPLPEPPKD